MELLLNYILYDASVAKVHQWLWATFPSNDSYRQLG